MKKAIRKINRKINQIDKKLFITKYVENLRQKSIINFFHLSDEAINRKTKEARNKASIAEKQTLRIEKFARDNKIDIL